MNFSINSKFKVWISIMVAVLVVGFTILGIFGFNQTVDYKPSYEVVVSIDTQLDEKITPAKLGETSRNYLFNKGFEAVDYATEIVDGPVGKYSIIYKFDKDINISVNEMKTYIQSKSVGAEAVIEVEYNNDVQSLNFNKTVGIIIAGVLATLAIFVYLVFIEKIASAVSVVCAAALSSLMFVAILGGARIPAQPFGAYACIGSFALSMILGVGMVNRFKEEIRLNDVENNKTKLSFVQIADKAARASLLRFAFVLAGIIVVSAVMIALGSAYVKFLGIQFIVAGLCAVFSSFVGIPLLWPVLKNLKK